MRDSNRQTNQNYQLSEICRNPKLLACIDWKEFTEWFDEGRIQEIIKAIDSDEVCDLVCDYIKAEWYVAVNGEIKTNPENPQQSLVEYTDETDWNGEKIWFYRYEPVEDYTSPIYTGPRIEDLVYDALTERERLKKLEARIKELNNRAERLAEPENHQAKNLKERFSSEPEKAMEMKKMMEPEIEHTHRKKEWSEPSKQVHTEAIPTPTKEIKNNTSATSRLLSSIEALMEEKDEDGEYLVSKQTHWMAIFRIIVDKNLGASNIDLLGFCNMINEGKPEGFRIALKHASLKKISNTKYIKPFGEWAYDPTYNPTRKPYDEMVKIATRFKEILGENGF